MSENPQHTEMNTVIDDKLQSSIALAMFTECGTFGTFYNYFLLSFFCESVQERW